MFHEEDEKSTGFWQTLSPKLSFLLGVIVSVMTICTVGFFILLSVVIKTSV